jgi:hypothetical protein
LAFDKYASKVPVFTALQLESCIATQNSPFFVDEEQNIFINKKLSNFEEVVPDPERFKNIDGTWVHIGNINTNILTPEDEVIKYTEFNPLEIEKKLWDVISNDRDE